MNENDVYYSYNTETGEVVSKTKFRNDGKVDRWDGINKPGYGHDIFESGKDFASGKKIPDSREVGENPDKIWKDKDGVLKKK